MTQGEHHRTPHVTRGETGQSHLGKSGVVGQKATPTPVILVRGLDFRRFPGGRSDPGHPVRCVSKKVPVYHLETVGAHDTTSASADVFCPTVCRYRY